MRGVFLGVAATVALCLTVVSCQDGVDLASSESILQQDIVEISAATIASRSGDGDEESDTYFEEGAQITIKGATSEAVIFTMNGDGDWVSVEPYEWIETPGVITAYYGNGAALEDGDQMPDICFAEYDCNGIIPESLDFTGEMSFKHTAALVRVNIDSWGDSSSMVVELSNIHNFSYVTSTGEFQSGSDIMSITLTRVSCESGYRYEGKIPAGDALTPNILSTYSLTVGGENIFNHIIDESAIPAYFTANTIYTFDLTNKTVE
ncbi:MAG: hypothetical protein SNF68_07140 [Rikenellaceae bacterium]